MIPIRPWARAAALLLIAGSLSACITLLPKSKPAQLYRFDGRAALAAAKPSDGAMAGRVGISRAGGSFQGAASGDRILTVTGSQVAYLADSRWSGPAAVLFDEALMGAFGGNTGPARLLARGEPALSTYSLRLDITRFEANYDQGPKAAPKVVVETHAALIRSADHVVVGDKVFRTELRASDDRVSAIVASVDQAVGKTLADLLAWTNGLVKAG
jgi:cholesterol transport system auxiliary component